MTCVSYTAPVAGGTKEQEEKHIDSEGVWHCHDGPFRYWLTGVLQLTWECETNQITCSWHSSIIQVLSILQKSTIRLETKKRMQINKGVCGCLVLYPTCWLLPWCLCSWWTSQQIQWRKTSLCWCCSPESSALQGETLGQNSCQWSNYINKQKQLYAPWWINAIQKWLCLDAFEVIHNL